MFDINNFPTVYQLAALGLLFVFAYFVVVSGVLRIPRTRRVSVARYEPPPGATPGVAAWLLERGRLPRAIAAALVNMAAKGYIKIDQTEDFVSVTQLTTKTPVPLAPEEEAIAWSLFSGSKYFDFGQTTPRLAECAEAFRAVLLSTEYFLPHVGLSVPAWAVSGIASFFVLFWGNSIGHGSGRGLGYLIFITVGCFVVAVRTLSGTLEKITSRLPGSTAPKRPWTGADTRPFWFLAASLVGLCLLGFWLWNLVAALLLGGFMATNAIFYYALQGPTGAGREMLEQLGEYRKFLMEAEADVISRTDPSDRVPARLDTKHAYAVAFHLDLGWGEQFVTSIASVIECAEVFEKTNDDDELPSLTGSK